MDNFEGALSKAKSVYVLICSVVGFVCAHTWLAAHRKGKYANATFEMAHIKGTGMVR
jgi:hypothetical protein